MVGALIFHANNSPMSKWSRCSRGTLSMWLSNSRLAARTVFVPAVQKGEVTP